MKPGIHPEYVESTVVCACGNTFQTRSTKPSIRLEICSACHPFFTGKQKFVDSAGRVERFQKRFAQARVEATQKPKAPQMAKGQRPALAKKKAKVLSSAPIVIPSKPGAASKTPSKATASQGGAAKSPPVKAH